MSYSDLQLNLYSAPDIHISFYDASVQLNVKDYLSLEI